MSRIIVKNLHKRVTEKELQKVFSVHGQVTDLQLKYTKNGLFRGFAFIGYSGESDANEAINALNNTYIGATKISVEICAALGSKDKPRGWSRYAADSSAYAKLNSQHTTNHQKVKANKPNKIIKFDELQNDDPKFREFLSVHGVNGTDVSWCDDPLQLPQHTTSKSAADAPQEAEKSTTDESTLIDSECLKKRRDVSDGDNGEARETNTKSSPAVDTAGDKATKVPAVRKHQIEFTVKITNIPVRAKKRYVREFLSPLKPKSLRLPPKIKSIAFAGFLTEKEMNQALNKHRTYHDGRCIEVRRYVDRKPPAVQSSTSAPDAPPSSATDSAIEPVGETGRIFVRNLPQCTTEEQLEQLFSKYGELVEMHLPVDRYSRKLKGFAFVGFMFPENAERAFSELDGSVFLGRMLHLIPAKPKVSVEEDGDEVSGNYKEKKERQQKREATSGHNWNTLFLGANTVAELMADRYDTSKKEVLSSEQGAGAAVRLALGETQLVAETRDFLQLHGVQLDVFAQPSVARSRNVILAKNLPANTSVETLRGKFAVYGRLGRLLLPPSGVSALVEFGEASEARAAFRALAYSRLGSAPLYLEWAPVGALTPADTADKAADTANDADAEQEQKQKSGDATLEDKSDDVTADDESSSALIFVDRQGDKGESTPVQSKPSPVDTPVEEGCVLFVKNINFDTSDDSLLEHFSQCGPVLSASVSRRARTSRENGEIGGDKQNQLLSQGYGFVTYTKSRHAQKALKRLQLSMLDSHTLELKLSNRTVQPHVKSQREKQTASKQKSAKIIVKNLPFQASKKEVIELFKTFGELNAVRLPKKLSESGSGHHRGFAFVEYNSRHDAKRAFNALCASTHLYGRRLVLDWAESVADEVDDLDALRHKTAARNALDDGPSRKRVKMDDEQAW